MENKWINDYNNNKPVNNQANKLIKNTNGQPYATLSTVYDSRK